MPKMKGVNQNKIKAFNIGNMNVRKGTLSKREQEDMKKKQDEQDAAKVYQDFVESFEGGKPVNKTWVKGGVVNPGAGEMKKPALGNKLYKPTSKLAELAQTFQSAKDVKKEEAAKVISVMIPKKKEPPKKKSNLELFKEELKIIQTERQERHKIKRQLGMGVPVEEPKRKSRFEPMKPELPPPPLDPLGLSLSFRDDAKSYADDPMTTNIYMGNINPKMSEQQLCELFGRHGPLASVKIMWPRTEEEHARGRNCGFVAFMNRRDADRAMDNIQGRDISGFDMKLSWGKPVPIPPHPIYIPPQLVELTMPPPPSGLPFNCQPRKGQEQPPCHDPHDEDSFNKTLANAVVKVVIPTERSVLCVIHRMIEFVVREGPMFEAMIMNREINNPMFRFLFENQSPAHVYYRWKLFSILHGENPYNWSNKEFRMFKGGSVWRPPPINPFTAGMPDELVGKPVSAAPSTSSSAPPSTSSSAPRAPQAAFVAPPAPAPEQPKKGQLSESQRDRLEDILRDLTPERAKVGDAMIWCLEHAEAAEEIVQCLAESLAIAETALPKKIARLYLVSDILHNCCARVTNASYFRKFLEVKLAEIFKDVHEYYDKIDGRIKAETFKQRVVACFRAWEDWAVYPNDLLIRLQNIFLGLVQFKQGDADEANEDGEQLDGVPTAEEVDGTPLPDEEIDGAPLPNDDLDGQEMAADDLDGSPMRDYDTHTPTDDVPNNPPKFVKSKWESVDEEEERRTVAASKWEMLQDEEDLDGAPMDESSSQNGDDSPYPDYHHGSRNQVPQQYLSEERRTKLREIEVKVMKYQDEVEVGKRSRKAGLTISQQVQEYREKLVRKEDERERREWESSRKDEERSKVKEWERSHGKDKKEEKKRKKALVKYNSSSESDGESSRLRLYNPSPVRSRRSNSPPSSHRSRRRSRSRSPRRRKSKSPKKSPKRSKRSRSRSRSRSPRRHKHKKNKR